MSPVALEEAGKLSAALEIYQQVVLVVHYVAERWQSVAAFLK